MDPKDSWASEKKPQVSNKLKRPTNEGLFMSVSKKAEKITMGLYMVTDLMDREDPIRLRIRSISLSMISDTRAMSYAITGDLYFQLARVIASAWEVVSLIEVAVVVGFISDMNYNVLKDALVEFISDLRNRQRIEGFQNIEDMKAGEGQAANLSLKNDFFRLNQYDMERISAEISSPDFSREGLGGSQAGAPKSLTKPKSPSPTNNDTKTSYPSSGKAEERQEKIMTLIRDKKEISIADIVDHFKDYSQKTVQRDLISLVAEGKIKRTGEKRWSRYSVL